MAMRNGFRGGRGGGRGGGRHGAITTKVFVGNLPQTCRKADLENLFKKFGEVVECDTVKDFGFVHFANESDAKAAVAALNCSVFEGTTMKVELSTSKVRQKPGMGSSTDCYRCNKPGHWSKDCPEGPTRGPDDRRSGGGKMGGGYKGGRDDRDHDPYPFAPPGREWSDYYREHYPPPPMFDRYSGRDDPYSRYGRYMPPPPPDYFRDRDPYARSERRSPPVRDPYYEMYLAAYERRKQGLKNLNGHSGVSELDG